MICYLKVEYYYIGKPLILLLLQDTVEDYVLILLGLMQKEKVDINI